MTRTDTWLRRGCVAALLALCVLTQPGSGTAQGQLVLKVATPHHPQSPWGRALDRFAQHVQTATRQRIRVRVFYESVLGADTAQVARVIDGSLQAYAGPIDALVPHVTALQALSTPSLFRSPEDAAKKLARSTDRIQTLLSEAGLRLGQWQHGGFHAEWSTRDAPLPPTTITDAVVRGVDRTATHIALTRYALAPGVLVYSQRWFDGLPAETQRLLSRLPDDLTTELTRDVAALEAELVQAMKARGITVTEPSAAETRRHDPRQAIDAHVQALTDAGRALYRQLSAP